MKRETKWLVTNLGMARDWDVFLAELLAPVMAARPRNSSLERLRVAADIERRKGYLIAQSAIRSARYAALIQRMRPWLSARAWRDNGKGEPFGGRAAKLATQSLKKRKAAVLTRGHDFSELTPLERHRLRIALKRLRYTAEFFSSLFPGKRRKAYLHSLSLLQDNLGHMNDVVVAEHLLGRLLTRRGKKARALATAIGMVIGWHACSAVSSESIAIENWREFCDSDLFW